MRTRSWLQTPISYTKAIVPAVRTTNKQTQCGLIRFGTSGTNRGMFHWRLKSDRGFRSCVSGDVRCFVFFVFFLLFRSHLNKKMANPVSQQHLIFHIAQRFCHALGLLQTNIQLLLNLYSEIISFSLSHHPEKSLSCPRIFNTRHPNLNSSTVIRYSFKCFFHHVSKSIKSIESSPS